MFQKAGSGSRSEDWDQGDHIEDNGDGPRRDEGSQVQGWSRGGEGR